MNGRTATLDRVARGLLLLAAAVGLRVAWLVFSRLGLGSSCDYPSDCTEWWYPETHRLIQQSWLVVLVAAGLGIALSWRAGRPARDLAVLGAAGLAVFLSVAITPMARGEQGFGMFEYFEDSYLWMRFGVRGLNALALVIAVASLLLAWQAVRRASTDQQDRKDRDFLLWWPVGATVPLAVITCSITAEAGRFVGLLGVAGWLAALPFTLALAGQLLAAYRRSVLGAAVAAMLVVAIELAVIVVSIKHRYDDEWIELSVDIACVVAALSVPVAGVWWSRRSRDRGLDPVGQELENTAGPPS